MCCETHDLRDFIARHDGGDLALAPEDNRRCRCTELGRWPGQACQREADGEDLLCPWCRTVDHRRWYERTALAGNPAVAAYYAEHGQAGYAYAYPGGPVRVRRLPREEGYREFAARLGEGAAGVTVSGQDLSISPRGLAEAERGISRGLGENGYSAAGYTASGPENVQWTDFSFRGGGPPPFTFSRGEIEAMRAADQAQGGPLAGYRLELTGEMTTEGVMRYLQRRYGA